MAAGPAAEPATVRPWHRHESHSAQQLAAALQRHGGNQSRAAQALGLTPRQFAYRWQKLARGPDA